MKPTDVQADIIPVILKRKNCLFIAPTGSGNVSWELENALLQPSLPCHFAIVIAINSMLICYRYSHQFHVTLL